VLTRASARLVARAAMRSGFGARALHQIVHEIADPWMFDAPETSSKSHRITAKEVGAALERLDEKGAFDDSAA
jgi:ATP-dependent protease Clp ATPase subunit